MGKVTSLYGKTTGKIGSIVFSTSGGETIAREYNPHVANPNTQAQVNQRARMKLMSQLSASLSPSIVMQKEGLISRRNKFVKKNFESCYASDGVAQVSYENVQLTEGNLGLTQISVVATVQNNIRTLSAWLTDEPSANVARVVYNVYTKSQEGQLSFFKSEIVTTRSQVASEATLYFPLLMNGLPSGDLVIYAYGMCDTSEQATANYGNLNVTDGTDIARLVATRKISFTDYQFTQTRGATIGANNAPVEPTPTGQARVFVTALGNGGTVSGGGTFEIGTTVSVSATPASGWVFSKWLKNGTAEVVSTANPYSFTLNGQTDLIAVFDQESHEGL